MLGLRDKRWEASLSVPTSAVIIIKTFSAHLSGGNLSVQNRLNSLAFSLVLSTKFKLERISELQLG